MKVGKKYTCLAGVLWLLCLILGVGDAWAQGIKVSGKACVPDQQCKADSMRFADSVRTGVTRRVWNFGDGSAAVTKTAAGDSAVQHVFQQAGTYTVTLTRTTSA